MLRLDNASVYHCSSTNVEGSLYGTKKLPCYNKVKLDCQQHDVTGNLSPRFQGESPANYINYVDNQ